LQRQAAVESARAAEEAAKRAEDALRKAEGSYKKAQRRAQRNSLNMVRMLVGQPLEIDTPSESD